tara:strand:- start:59 stop:583 length:525 start_codon:yes stop_codon:yes gene_type:complete
MKKTLATVAIAAALSTALNAHAFDLGGLLDGDEEKLVNSAKAAATNSDTSVNTNTNMMSQGLLDLLSSQLDVSPTQAAGGVGALMGLANNSLPTEYSQQLNSLLPGLKSSSAGGNSLTSSLLGSVKDMDSVNTAFSALGMDPSMVHQFVPLITGYVGDSSGTPGLMSALSSVWK